MVQVVDDPSLTIVELEMQPVASVTVKLYTPAINPLMVVFSAEPVSPPGFNRQPASQLILHHLLKRAQLIEVDISQKSFRFWFNVNSNTLELV
jgi:hypothetical protein